MPATGVSGVDLYAHLNDRWQWLAVAKPAAQTVDTQLIAELPAGSRDYTLYLPLYNGVSSLEIGTPTGAAISPWPRAQDVKPILYYGTSIAQGACASRPGMAFTNILSRRLDRPIINEAFSGNGKMDLELAPLFAEIDAAVYVIDTLPNMTPDLIKERAEPFVRALRAKRPNTPILLVEDRTGPAAPLQPNMQKLHANRRANLRAAYEDLKKDDPHLSYLEGAHLLGDDSEGTTDGSHPNDLGMVRYADALEPALRKAMS
jgi:lysophospholipase L1-like esterase